MQLKREAQDWIDKMIFEVNCKLEEIQEFTEMIEEREQDIKRINSAIEHVKRIVEEN